MRIGQFKSAAGTGAGCSRVRRFEATRSFEPLEDRVLFALNPTPDEQYMLELLNRFRTHPQAELGYMTSSLGNPARSDDPDIDAALRFFETKGTVLSQQWSLLQAVQPLAWNEDLYNAAAAHTQKMIDVDEQTHQATGELDLGDRVAAAGYDHYSLAGENIYAFARSVLHAHAGFAIDWGGGTGGEPSQDGIQNPPGHRDNMLEAEFREVGIRFLSENNSSTDVGPLLVTQDFGNRFDLGHSFLLGVVYTDSNRSSFYESGEGLGGVTVQVVGSGGSFTTTSFSAGGYQLQVPNGLYDVTFSGGAFGSAVTYRNITVGSENVKVDAIRGVAPPAPEIAILSGDGGNGSTGISSGDTTPATTDGTNFGLVNLVGSRTQTFTITNLGQAALKISGSPRVRITGAGASYFQVVDDADGLVQPGGSTSFSIRFVPIDTRLKVATVTISNDDSNEGTYTFRIKARGLLAPIVAVLGANGTEIADGDTTPTNADGTNLGMANVANRVRNRDFSIVNNGSAALSLTSFGSSFVRFTGLNPGDFRVVIQPDSSIAPGQSTTFRIQFNPSAAGTRLATLQLQTNDPDLPTYDFTVRGLGVLKPIVQVLGNGIVVGSVASPTDAAGTQFGPVTADGAAGASLVRVFTIRNAGSSTLTFTLTASTRAAVAGRDSTQFKVFRQPPRTIGIGQTGVFRIRFDPITMGDFNAVIAISPTNGDQFTFRIAGTGV